MANFNTHVFVAAATSTGTALVAVNGHLLMLADIPWLIFMGVLGGMLPDIDASNSRPIKLLFDVLALMGMAAALRVLKDNYGPYPLALIVAGTYLFIRHLAFALFNRFTVHRGVFHSLLAAVFFALLTTCISYRFLQWNVLQAWLNGLFIAQGVMVHLLLDELYSVDLSNARMKKSFGTALKLFNYNSISASALMALCALVLHWLAPAPPPLVKAWQGAHWNKASIHHYQVMPSHKANPKN